MRSFPAKAHTQKDDSPFPPTDTGRCGTSAGYQRHKLKAENPCQPCRTARTQESVAYHIRVGRQNSIQIPVEVLGEILDKGPTVLEDWLPERITQAIRSRLHGRG